MELRRNVNHLTALHRAGLLFSSTLDRETLLQQVLETLTRDLHYDRAMISFYDPVSRVTTTCGSWACRRRSRRLPDRTRRRSRTRSRRKAPSFYRASPC